MPSVGDLLEAFMRDRRGEGKRPMGVQRYKERLVRFDRWLEGRDVAQIDAIAIMDYRNDLAERCAISTTQTALITIRAFCRWAVERGHLEVDPSAKIRVPRRPKTAPKPLNPDELAALWAALQDEEEASDVERWKIRRNRLICFLMYYAGLRLGEVAKLRWSDCSIRYGTITVRDGKGGKDRSIPIHPELLAELANWASGRNREDPVVQGQRTTHRRDMSPGSIAHVFERWLPARGVKISAHRLRHSFATAYLRASKDIRGLQDLLGHASLDTTMRYTLVVVDEKRSNIARVPALSEFEVTPSATAQGD